MQITSSLFLKKSLFIFSLWCWRCKPLKVFKERPCAGYGFSLLFKKQLLGYFYIGPRGVIFGKILWDVLLHFWEHRLEIVARIFVRFMIIKTDRCVQWLSLDCNLDIKGFFFFDTTGLVSTVEHFRVFLRRFEQDRINTRLKHP